MLSLSTTFFWMTQKSEDQERSEMKGQIRHPRSARHLMLWSYP